MADIKKDYICSECHYIGKPKLVKKTSKVFQALSWIIFPFGFLFYFIWQLFNKSTVCNGCGGTMLVDKNTPVGRRLISFYAPGMEMALGIDEPSPVVENALAKQEKSFSADDFKKADAPVPAQRENDGTLQSTRITKTETYDPNKPHEW